MHDLALKTELSKVSKSNKYGFKVWIFAPKQVASWASAWLSLEIVESISQFYIVFGKHSLLRALGRAHGAHSHFCLFVEKWNFENSTVNWLNRSSKLLNSENWILSAFCVWQSKERMVFDPTSSKLENSILLYEDQGDEDRPYWFFYLVESNRPPCRLKNLKAILQKGRLGLDI